MELPKLHLRSISKQCTVDIVRTNLNSIVESERNIFLQELHKVRSSGRSISVASVEMRYFGSITQIG